jgi:hypothetical protein
MNRKSAPQKTIVEIQRTGEWGKVEYRHRLSCGHTEVRKRASATPKIACTWCVVAEEKQKELKALTVVPPPVLDEQVWDFFDSSVADELSIAKMRSDIASVIGCENENIEVVSSVDDDGVLRLNYVTIFLDAQQAEVLASKARRQ